MTKRARNRSSGSTRAAADRRAIKQKSGARRRTESLQDQSGKRHDRRSALQRFRTTARPKTRAVRQQVVATDAELDIQSAAAGSRSVRLQKYLAAAGIGSRRRCEEYIVLGRVSVDGRTVTELGTCVDPETQKVCFDGEAVRPEPKVYWWVNKPAGVLCTSRDTHGRPTALDLVPSTTQRVYCVGRLDEASTGLVLVTNDGELALKLTHPRYGISTTYVVLAAGKMASDAIDAMRKGAHFREGAVRPRSIRRLGFRGQATLLSVVLCEGRNEEVRRMFARFGHKVLSVQRTAIGPVKIRKLRRGQSRSATREEIAMLRRLARGNRVGVGARSGKADARRVAGRSGG